MVVTKRYFIYFLLVIFFTFIGYKLLPKNEIIITEEKTSSGENKNFIYVHIDGAVLNPRNS